eukprot:2429198-Rhodomonas_salina.1
MHEHWQDAMDKSKINTKDWVPLIKELHKAKILRRLCAHENKRRKNNKLDRSSVTVKQSTLEGHGLVEQMKRSRGLCAKR